MMFEQALEARSSIVEKQTHLGWEPPVEDGELDVVEVLGALAEWEAPPPPDDPADEGLECDDPEDEAPEDEDEPPPDECADPEDEIAECDPPPLLPPPSEL